MSFEELANSKDFLRELLFELRTKDGHLYRIYLDGRYEGFPDGTYIVNKAAPLFYELQAFASKNNSGVVGVPCLDLVTDE